MEYLADPEPIRAELSVLEYVLKYGAVTPDARIHDFHELLGMNREGGERYIIFPKDAGYLGKHGSIRQRVADAFPLQRA